MAQSRTSAAAREKPPPASSSNIGVGGVSFDAKTAAGKPGPLRSSSATALPSNHSTIKSSATGSPSWSGDNRATDPFDAKTFLRESERKGRFGTPLLSVGLVLLVGLIAWITLDRESGLHTKAAPITGYSAGSTGIGTYTSNQSRIFGLDRDAGDPATYGIPLQTAGAE